MNLKYNKQKLKEICDRNDISYLGVFGSYARGEASSKSDVDLLVEFEKPKGFEFFKIENELSDLFDKKVDLTTPDSLSKYIQYHALSNVKTLYGKTRSQSLKASSY